MKNMKRIPAVVLFFAIITGFVTAQEDGIGLTAGLEFEFADVSGAVASDFGMFIIPSIEYKTFINDFGIRAYLDIMAGAGDGVSEDGSVPVSMVIELEAWYKPNLAWGRFTPSVGLLTEFAYDISPDTDDPVYFGIEPMAKFKAPVFYGIIGFPVSFVHQNPYYDKIEGRFYATLGWSFNSGFTFEIHSRFGLDTFYTSVFEGVDFFFSYETGAFYCELEVGINTPENFGFFDQLSGIFVRPEFQYTFFDGFTAFLGINIGSSGRTKSFGFFNGGEGILVSPYLGAKYSF